MHRFFQLVRRTSPRIASLFRSPPSSALRGLSLSLPASLFLLSSLPPLLSFSPLAAASSRQSDHNLSCRTFIRSGRCEMCFDVLRLVLPLVLPDSREHTLVCVGRVGAGTSMSPPPSWCGQRLMSPRQSRARACHSDSIRYSSHRLPCVFLHPVCLPLFLFLSLSTLPPPLSSLVLSSFNRLLRILSSDRADTARGTCCNSRAALTARPH